MGATDVFRNALDALVAPRMHRSDAGAAHTIDGSYFAAVYGMDLTTRAERDAATLTAFGSKHVQGATAVSPDDLSMKDTPKAKRLRYYISQAGGKSSKAGGKTGAGGKGCAKAGVLLGRTLYDNEDLSPSARAAAEKAYAAGKPFNVYAFGCGQAVAAIRQAEWGPKQDRYATLESVNALEESKAWTKRQLKCSFFDGMRACLTVAKTIPGSFELCFDFRLQSSGSILGVFPHVRLCHDGPWIKLAVADQMIGVSSNKRFTPVGKKELERAGITDRSLNSWVEAALDFTSRPPRR